MLTELPLSAIVPNPDQPRKHFDPAALAELAASIRAVGLQQPITVRPVKRGRYEIVAGERRWRAHAIAGFKSIACHVRRMDELERDVAAIVENLQREDITPLEEADAFARLAQAGLDPDAIAEKIGVAPFRVKWRLQLLNLCPEIRKLFEGQHLDRQQAMEISRLPGHREQLRVLHMIRRGQLVGWKAVRNAVDGLLGGEDQADIFGASAPAASRDDIAQLSDMERRIESVAAMVARGWRDGECVIACRVNPDRAAHVASQIAEIGKALRIMERELRNTLGQAALHAA